MVICYQILSGDVTDHLPQYATLKAIGYGNGYLAWVVLQESLILAVLGFLVGWAASVGAYQVLSATTGLPLPFFSAYAASKAALVRLTETFAEELKEARVDVNAIAPGALNTRLLDEVLAAGPQREGQDFYRRSLQQKQEGGAPLERGAELAVFLASPRSDGLSGRLISAVWDDWAALPGQKERLMASDVYTLRRIVPRDRGWE